MAVTYEDFKKRFDTIKATIDKYAKELDSHERYMGQTTGVMQEGIKEVGLRVQELKDGGTTGTTIDAFMGDPSVKKMMTEIKGYLAGIQKELVKGAALQGEIKKTATAFYALKTDLTNEIAKRKKEVTTKLGTGNKSLPDMEKMLAEMKKYQDAVPYAKVEVFVVEKYEDHLKEATGNLNKQIAQAKDVALSAFQKEMQEQALNTRVLNGKVALARGWYTTVMKQCVEGQKALAAKKAKELMAAKTALVKPWKDLQDMNAMYQDALKDQWIASKLRTSKDKSTIESNVKLILDMKTKAGAEVAKIANARV
jgi:hypothetical protein